MRPEQAFSSDKMVLALLPGVSIHWLYRSTAKENHGFYLIEATVQEEIQCNTTCKKFAVVPKLHQIKWSQNHKKYTPHKAFTWSSNGTRLQHSLTRHSRDQSAVV